MRSLSGRVCVVTGGASGIGAAICRAFAKEGGRVAVVDVDIQKAADLARTIEGSLSFACDVSDAGQVTETFSSIRRQAGRIDVLVNNAGIVGKQEYGRVQEIRKLQLQELEQSGKIATPLRATVNLTDEQWRRMIDIHLTGTFLCTRAALLMMEERRSGVIINMSSVNGLDGGMGNPHYSAAKAGILGFTRAVAKDVIGQGIRVNAIAPGFVDTPLRDSIAETIQRAQIAATPIARPATSDEIAATAVFLASDDASYYVGETFSPNGGYLTI